MPRLRFLYEFFGVLRLIASLRVADLRRKVLCYSVASLIGGTLLTMLATPELLNEAAQTERLNELLPAWLREVPLYRGADRGENGIVPFQKLPFITKADIRRNFPRNFLRPGIELDELLDQELVEVEHTSGTSEERTSLLLGQGWWAEQEERALRLNPLVNSVLEQQPQARRVTIVSPVCSGDISYTGVPGRSARVVNNALFVVLSRLPFLWSDDDLARMVAEAADWNPVFLDVDPVYGVLFALYCERHGIRFPGLKFVLCSYEFVSVVHRRILERVFQVPALNLYGSTETGHLLMDSGDGLMAPSLETAYLELTEVDSAGVGNVVVTTLTNDFMPLVRYRIGDLAEKFTTPAGTRYRVHGRAMDALKSGNERRVTVWQIDQLFAEVEGVAHYQILEQQPGKLLLRYARDGSGPAAEALEELQRRLKLLLGNGSEVALESSQILMPESSGKFRLVYPFAGHNQ